MTFDALGAPVPDAILGTFGSGLAVAVADLAYIMRPSPATVAVNMVQFAAFIALYNDHLQDTSAVFHFDAVAVTVANTFNDWILPVPTDAATFLAAVVALQVLMDDHGQNVGGAFHSAADTNAFPAAVPTTYAQAVATFRALVWWFEAHRVETAGVIHAGVNAPDIINVANAIPALLEHPYNLTAAAAADYKLEPGSLNLTLDEAGVGVNFLDDGAGAFVATAAGSTGTINYTTGDILLAYFAGSAPGGVAAGTGIVALQDGMRRVADSVKHTFRIDASDTFTDAVLGGWPAFLDPAGVNTIVRATGTINFGTLTAGVFATDVVIPDGAVQANYTDMVTTVDVEQTDVHWYCSIKGEGAWGNQIILRFTGDIDSWDAPLLTDPIVGTWSGTGAYTTFGLEVVEVDPVTGLETSLEQFDELNMVNPALPNYFPDVINDTLTGSGVFRVDTPYGVTMADDLDSVDGRTPTPFGVAGTGLVSNYQAIVNANGIEPGTLRVTYVDALAASHTFYDDGYGNLIDTLTPGALNAGGVNTVNYLSGAINVTLAVPLGIGLFMQASAYYKPASDTYDAQFSSGTDGVGTIGTAQITASGLSATSAGIYAFRRILEPLTGPVCPDLYGNFLADTDIITFCENAGNFFAPLWVPEGLDAGGVVHYRKSILAANTQYAALYAPLVTIQDPVLEVSTNVPGLGHVAGIYARMDNDRNVGEAPAGTDKGRLFGVLGLERDFEEADVGLMTKAGINALVEWDTTGRVVWGARSLAGTGLGEWKYLQSTRLFQYVGMSLYLSTWWACFENNGANLRLRLRTQITQFLRLLYNQNYFSAQATSESEAFRVICDDTNNPQAVVDLGQVVVDVYIAPNKPAEFVRIRLQQLTNG